MNPIASSSLMTILLVAAFSACEGEPPRVPSNPTVEPPAVEPIDASTTPPAAPRPVPIPAAQAMDAGDVGSDAQSEAATEATPPGHGSITGTVTTTPANLARQAVVYLEDAPKEPDDKRTHVTIDNRQMTFSPFIAVVTVGGKVTFANSDPFPHNVFSPDNGGFNMGSIPLKSARARTFQTPGVYTLLCNLHPGMIGYLLVAPSSYVAKANASGKFVIENVPAGTYKATAWAPRNASVTETVVVVAEGDPEIHFELKRK